MRATRSKRSGREETIRHLLKSSKRAEAEGDASKMRRLSYKLLRFELYERAWQLRVRATGLMQQSPIPDSDGSDLSGRSILIRNYSPRTVSEKAAAGAVYRSGGRALPPMHRACRTAISSAIAPQLSKC